MAIRAYQPTTPGRRGMTTQDMEAITISKPVKSLITIKKGRTGRNNQGRITTRHRGGGVKRYLRFINFNLPLGTIARVEHIEYDPGRSARIARLKDQNSQYHYILAPKGLKQGAKIVVALEGPVEVGNRLPLQNIPVGTLLHAVELQPGRGAQLGRSAGTGVQLAAKDEAYAQLRLPSGEVRLAPIKGMASVGAVGNEQHQNVQLGKAGRKRHMGIRPTVRGIAMNAVDHPLGGGDGGAHGLGRNPKTPWGRPTLGFKTRRRKTNSTLIIKNRHQGKRR